MEPSQISRRDASPDQSNRSRISAFRSLNTPLNNMLLRINQSASRQFSKKLQRLETDTSLSPADKKWIVNNREAPEQNSLLNKSILAGASLKSITTLLKMGADPVQLTATDPYPLQLAIERGRLNLVKTLLSFNAEVPPDLKQKTFETGLMKITDKPQVVEFKALVKLLSSLRGKVKDSHIVNEFYEVIRQTGSLYAGYLYLRAFQEAISPKNNLHGIPLARLWPRLKPGSIDTLLGRLEEKQDMVKKGWHASEAEMLVMLQDPRLWQDRQRNKGHISALTRAVTSPYQVIHKGIPTLTGAQVKVLAELGRLNHSFRLWRFDCELPGVKPGKSEFDRRLIERFGFHQSPDRHTDHRYGRGFFHSSDKHSPLERSAGRGLVELRRAYLLVSHSEDGTLLVRNSSLVFGRNTMKHAAYWSASGIGNGFSEAQLLNISPNDVGRTSVFLPVLHADALKAGVLEDDRIPRLTKKLSGLMDGYRAWKFDTDRETAWWEAGASELLTGGHLSPGFSALVDFLEVRHNHAMHGNRLMPELAFFHRGQPPIVPIEYHHPVNGPSRTWEVEENDLFILRALAETELDERSQVLLESSGLLSFLQTGLDHQAELTLVAPSKSEETRTLPRPI